MDEKPCHPFLKYVCVGVAVSEREREREMGRGQSEGKVEKKIYRKTGPHSPPPADLSLGIPTVSEKRHVKCL